MLFMSDNSSAVCNINSGTSKLPHMLQLLRALHYIAATRNLIDKGGYDPSTHLTIQLGYCSRQSHLP